MSVCLYDTRLKRGGMNHYMLPTSTRPDTFLGRGKCGDYAIARLLSLASTGGSRREDLVASVYGGANVVGHLGSAATVGLYEIGQRNVDAAMVTLRGLAIKVLRHDTGGVHGRKIHMQTGTNAIEVITAEASADRLKQAQMLKEFRQRRIRVLVIDDSRVVRHVLRKGIALAPDLEVIAEAADAYEARERILELDPDVLCLDIIMPRMDGLAFLRRVMRYKPIPTVIVSTIAKRGTDIQRRAQAAGAVAVIDKDELAIYEGTGPMERVLLPALRRAAATVVHRTVG